MSSQDGSQRESTNTAAPRMRRPDREQGLLVPLVIDELVGPNHPVRLVWRVVQSWDLSKFEKKILARGSDPGRPSTDPRLLLALWLWALIEGVGSGREIERLCDDSASYRWLRGGLSINYHTLNDFRVEHERALDDLLTQMLAALTRTGMVQVQRIAQDGTRVRASAGSNSFRRKSSIVTHLALARQHLQEIKQRADDSAAAAKQRKLQERTAADRIDRLEKAMEEVQEVEAAKARQKKKPSKDREARASTTDPEARLMRMADGGYRPAYNVQLAVDPQSLAIVGVDVTNNGSDAGLCEPMREQVETRTGAKVSEHLMDGGYVRLESIEAAAAAGVATYAPVPKTKNQTQDAHAPRADDGPGVAQWRARMATDQAKEIFKERSASVERANADIKTHRGLSVIPVRGLLKARSIALWTALAYNIKLFGAHLLT